MRKFAVIALALGLAGLVWAASGYAGRRVASFTSTGVISASEVGDGVRLAGLTVKYTTQGSVTSLRATVGPFTNATAIVYAPAELWVWRQDLLTISNAVPAIANVIIDYSY